MVERDNRRTRDLLHFEDDGMEVDEFLCDVLF